MTTKLCTSCKIQKPLFDFYYYRSDRYYAAKCKGCYKKKVRTYSYSARRDIRRGISMRLINLKSHARLHGYTPPRVTVEQLIQAWTGYCYICGQSITLVRGEEKSTSNIEHDHKSGRFRGWVCRGCNTIIGHANDSVERLHDVIRYLEKHQESTVELPKAISKLKL